jgi:hypothetical protein
MPKPKPLPKQPAPVHRALAPITHEDIALRAYALYEARNKADGYALDDWLEAERQLLEEKNGLAMRRIKLR